MLGATRSTISASPARKGEHWGRIALSTIPLPAWPLPQPGLSRYLGDSVAPRGPPPRTAPNSSAHRLWRPRRLVVPVPEVAHAARTGRCVPHSWPPLVLLWQLVEPPRLQVLMERGNHPPALQPTPTGSPSR